MSESIISRRVGSEGRGVLTGSFKLTPSTSNLGVFSVNVDFEPSKVFIFTVESNYSWSGITDFLWDAEGVYKIGISDGGNYNSKSHGSDVISTTYANGLFTLAIKAGHTGNYGFARNITFNYYVIE